MLITINQAVAKTHQLLYHKEEHVLKVTAIIVVMYVGALLVWTSKSQPGLPLSILDSKVHVDNIAHAQYRNTTIIITCGPCVLPPFENG